MNPRLEFRRVYTVYRFCGYRMIRSAWRAVRLTAIIALAGCAAVAPDTLRIEAQHVSHLTQHLTADPTNFGYTAVALEVHWQRGHWFADASEGVVIDPRDHKVEGGICYGGLWGPREVFQARTGWEISLK